jgi:hypothetical protein
MGGRWRMDIVKKVTKFCIFVLLVNGQCVNVWPQEMATELPEKIRHPGKWAKGYRNYLS